ncbi:MAG: hypothetical protein H0V05_15470 [Euzebyaceae bacterium]|nr:hypothetical protein [Euzebyaceae bacterium]
MLRRDELADLLTRRVRGLRQGHSLAEAVEDLLDEVEVYHGKWEQDLHRAPNQRSDAGGSTEPSPPKSVMSCAK